VQRKDLPHLTWQLALLTSMGGFGLGSAGATSPIAYVAAVVNSLRWAPVLRQYGRPGQPLPATAQLSANLTDALERVRGYADRAADCIHPGRLDQSLQLQSMSTVLPDNTAGLYDFFSSFSDIQSALTQRINKIIHTALVSRADLDGKVEEAARWQALTATHAGHWLTVKPCERDLILADQAWSWAARLRLGVPVAQVADAPRCHSCGRENAFTADTWHHLSCVTHS
jgi:hypothetical protein